ncbi:MAG: hypothetical protein JSS00_00585 [Proteobacteria bacterium]|nr:hypothetical protein [Pseudomonadota bacterium]
MRVWLMHPAVFYPLAAIVAATVIAISIRPQSWPHAPAAVAGQQIGGALVLAQSSFDAPAGDADQNLYVTRNFLGQAQTLRIAALPSTPAPGANDRGVQILLSSAAATALANQPATISVNYNPLPINAATGLAVSLQGAGPAVWVTQAAPPQQGMLRFEVPAQAGVSAVGLRAISNNGDQHEAYGLEITRISITPHP